jgi:hypothetical protein
MKLNGIKVVTLVVNLVVVASAVVALTSGFQVIGP